MSAVLVMAKAPVPGLAKTRLASGVGPRAAAELAAAALLDVLDAGLGSGHRTLVAVAGRVSDSVDASAVQAALGRVHDVFGQSGRTFGERLHHAHQTAHRLSPGPVVQIGTDTPQVTAELLDLAVRGVGPDRAVLGPATDGGWWALGLPAPEPARLLVDVPMSRADTGLRTREAMLSVGLSVHALDCLRDVDEVEDARLVAELASGTRFARRFAELRRVS